MGDEQPDMTPGGVPVSVPTAPEQDKLERDLENMVKGSYDGRKKRQEILHSLQRVVRRMRIPINNHG